MLVGREAIHGFFANIATLKRESELLTLRVAGGEAAFLFAITIAASDSPTRIEPINVMTFDDEGRIATMKAYWSSADAAPPG